MTDQTTTDRLAEIRARPAGHPDIIRGIRAAELLTGHGFHQAAAHVRTWCAWREQR